MYTGSSPGIKILLLEVSVTRNKIYYKYHVSRELTVLMFLEEIDIIIMHDCVIFQYH